MKTNYVLIDLENVQTTSFEQLAHNHFKVIVFVGANQAKLVGKVVKSLEPLGSRAECITISGCGPNALDFHIAYYIGRYAVTAPSASFYIISKDTGFNPLIQHLKSQNIVADRFKTVADIPPVKVSNDKSPQEHIDIILTRLQNCKTAKPKTVKKLSNMIRSRFQNKLSKQEVSSLVQNLRNQGYLKVAGAKLTYALPAPKVP